ncbi:MAG TPA: hypothetical protein VLS89_09805 [Candidatus Nanopelagicales bacterium]|nr:hypothetical protein [Candidatus Nanopelagicales bacterium]
MKSHRPLHLAAMGSTAVFFLLGAIGCSDEEPAPSKGGGGAPALSGALTYERVPHRSAGEGLDYGAITALPIRGARVELLARDGSVLAETVSGDVGRYVFALEKPVRARVRVYSETVEPPIVVEDNTEGDALYALESAEIEIDGAKVQDLAATTGWDGQAYSGVRAAAPFAVLDAAYTASRRFSAEVSPPPAFPPLNINWSAQNRPEDGSVLAGQIGTSHWDDLELYILGMDGVDTDEFDTHVIVHEWGHYFESRVSRADSPGGPHGYGDVLDPRVAFSEGWGNALSAMILDPDTVYSDALGPGQANGFSWDLELNDTSPSAVPGWFSESSVETILFDLYDAAAEPHDQLALGLGPIYEVMSGDMRETPALTTIFPFIAGLKARRPEDAAAIDALVTHHRADSALGVDVITDAWGTGETHGGNIAGSLPIYVDGAKGASITLSLSGGFDYNFLGQNRYVRVTGDGSPLTVSSTSAEDVDLYAHASGEVVAVANTLSGDETVTFPTQAGQVYVINVQGYALHPGDYTATLEISP